MDFFVSRKSILLLVLKIEAYMLDPDMHPVRKGGSTILHCNGSGSIMKILLKRPVLLLSWPAGQQLHFLQEQGNKSQVKVIFKVKAKVKFKVKVTGKV